MKQVENAKVSNIEMKKANLDIKPKKRIVLKEYHSKEYLSKIEQAQSEKVLFILPNGKEYTNEKQRS
jgi:hypothetical protein